MASQQFEKRMTNTLEIASEVRAWASNYEMLKSFSTGLPADVAATRDAAMQAFVRLGFPTTKHEEWKYTSLRNLVEGNLMPVFRPLPTAVKADDLEFPVLIIPELIGGNVIVLVNGHFVASLSKLEPGVVHVESLKQALENGNASALAHYGRIASTEQNALVALNTAVAQDGVFIHIPKHSKASSPISILHLSDGDQLVSNCRSLILAEDLSETSLVEIWDTAKWGSNWENHVSEIHVGVGAKLELTAVQVDMPDSFSLTNFTQVVQEKDSTFRSMVMSSSGQLVRNDLQVRHAGSGCNSYLNGLTMLNGDSHVDHHTLVDHAMPHCYSNENYKTVLDGNSTAVFNGKVMVRPDAQKTNAFQSNKTLLLSEGAKVYAKPQLEIFADDVKCSHGATTGQLDETAMFYMRSRGLSRQKARALLTYAFGAEVLGQISNPMLRFHLESTLQTELGGF
jgi:Fe-S cluster assembly protein SufD